MIAGDDIYRIETLLQAMGVHSLDRARPGERGKSIRVSGLQVVASVSIVSFEEGWGTVKPHYFLKLMYVKDSHHSLEGGSFSSSEEGQPTRHALEQYGISFAFQVQGTLAHWQWFQVVEELSASFALLALSALVVKYMAVYVFPLGQVYHKAMHKISPHIDKVEKLLRKKDDKIRAAHKRYFPHRDEGTIEDQVLRLSAAQIDISSDSESEASDKSLI
eukprot:Skav222889  [mRNA]  locus=scaffold1102:193649:194302:- [translate_table: standard]